MDKNNNASVLIVGAGPTGLVFALWLTQLGIKVRIIDKNEDAGLASRALVIQSRTLELYHQMGIADEVIAKGIKLKYFELKKNGKTIKTVDIENIGKGITPYAFILSYPQDEHERLLITHLKRRGVTVERNTKLISFMQDEDKVIAVMGRQGIQQTAEFAYLCGCDGGHSTVRQQLGMHFPGGTYKQEFFVADVKSSDAVMQGVQIGITDADFCLAFPVRSSKTVRLIGIIPPKYEHKEDVEFSSIQEAVARNIRIQIEAVHWFSKYHVHHRMVTQFNKGRVFLLGDAAHIHSPVGGQGMNTGIGDAVNLSWKLAAVLKGHSCSQLLETYGLERQAFAKKLVYTTDKLFQLVTSTSWLGFAWRGFIFPYVFPTIFKYKALRVYFFTFVSQMKINYRMSWLSCENPGKLKGGDRLPWIDLADCDNFKPLNALAWQVHVYGKARLQLHPMLRKYNITLHQFAWSAHMRTKGLIEHAAYLIRPDGYISVVDPSGNGQQIEKMLLRIHYS